MAKRKSNKQVKAMIESKTGAAWITSYMRDRSELMESVGIDGDLTGYEIGDPIVIYGNGDIKRID